MKKNKDLHTWLHTLCQSATPCIDECITQLGDAIPWLLEFKDTPQDPEWHAEGNVHIHTGMVLDECYALLKSEAAHIQGERRQVLILSALLHDIGKPKRTKTVEIKGIERIASPQHESVGRSYLAFRLLSLPLSFNVVWSVLGLVGEHHMPKRLAVKNSSRGDYLALSRRADTELLYWLEVADMRGRICPDLNTQLSHLDEFALFAKDYDVWGKPYELPLVSITSEPTESAQAEAYLYAQGLRAMEEDRIYHPDETRAYAYQHKDQYTHVIMMCGPSASGKSTWIQSHAKDYELISLDELRQEICGDRMNQKNNGKVIHAAKDKLKDCLRRKANVVWDATNLRTDFRSIIFDIADSYNGLVTIVSFLLPEKTLLAADQKRTYSVGKTVIDTQIDSYQFPLAQEAHRLIVIGENGTEHYRTGFPIYNQIGNL